MKTFCYVLKLIERLYDDSKWTDEELLIIEEHFQRIKLDFEKGIVLQVGRTLDPKYDGFGLVVFKSENEEEARRYMNEDPAVVTKLMIASLHAYKVIFN